MPKITAEDIKRIQAKNQGTVNLRDGTYRVNITVHMGPCGIAAGAREVIGTLLRGIEENRLNDVVITSSGCAGDCKQEPMMTIHMQGGLPVRYGNLSPEKTERIFNEHVLKGNDLPEYALPVDG